MAYKRKTKDVYVVQQYTGKQYGWEDVYVGQPILPKNPELGFSMNEFKEIFGKEVIFRRKTTIIPRDAKSGRLDAKLRLKEYEENQPEYPARVIKKRIPLQKGSEQ